MMKLQDMDEWDQYMTLSVKALKLNNRVKMGEAVQQETVGRSWMELKKPQALANSMPTEFEGHWRLLCDFSPRKINF